MKATWVGSGLIHKHYTRLKRLSRDKHSNLVGPFLLKWTQVRVYLLPIRQGVNLIKLFMDVTYQFS